MANRSKKSTGVSLDYLRAVIMDVASQGKPTGNDYVGEMINRFGASLKNVVPAKNRLGVRTAIKGLANRVLAASASA